MTASAPWAPVARTLPTLNAQPLYLRGSMHRWSTQHPLALGHDGLHRVALELAAGGARAQGASEDWTLIDPCRGQQAAPLAGSGKLPLLGVGGNIALELRQRARCELVVDEHDPIAPQLTVHCRPL